MINRKDYRAYYSFDCKKCCFYEKKRCNNLADIEQQTEMSCVKGGKFIIFKLIKKEQDNAEPQ